MANDDLVLRIPHNLGAAEAQRRIAAGVESAKSQYGTILKAAQTDWDANRLHFRVSALAQTVVGAVEVGEDFVELRAQLPILIRLLAKRFLPTVKSTGRKLLTKGVI